MRLKGTPPLVRALKWAICTTVLAAVRKPLVFCLGFTQAAGQPLPGIDHEDVLAVLAVAGDDRWGSLIEGASSGT